MLKSIKLMIIIFIMITMMVNVSYANKTTSRDIQIKNGFKIIAVESNLFPTKEGGNSYAVNLHDEPLIEFIDNKLIVYEITKYFNNDGYYFDVKKDENGNKVQLKRTDKDYFNKLFQVLDSRHNEISTRISYDSPQDEISFTVLTKKHMYKREDMGNDVSSDIYGIYRRYEKKYFSFSQSFVEEDHLSNYKGYTEGTIIIIDDTFICKTFEPNIEVGYKLINEIAINPDVFDYSTIPMSHEFIKIPNYTFCTETGKGYLWGQIGNPSFITGGVKGKFGYKPIIKNGVVFIETNIFLSQLYAEITTDTAENTYTIHRLKSYNKRNKVDYLKLRFTYGNCKYYLNEEEYLFYEPPFIAQGFYGHYLPLKDICTALKINYKWREFDKSFLIEKFAGNEFDE